VLPQIGMAHHMASGVRSRMNRGFQAFQKPMSPIFFWRAYSSSSIPIRNQRKRPSLKGVTSQVNRHRMSLPRARRYTFASLVSILRFISTSHHKRLSCKHGGCQSEVATEVGGKYISGRRLAGASESRVQVLPTASIWGSLKWSKMFDTFNHSAAVCHRKNSGRDC